MDSASETVCPQDSAHESVTPSAAKINKFLCKFCTAILSSGAHTMRTNRNAVRIAATFGFEVELAVFPKHFMITTSSIDGSDTHTSVGSIYTGTANLQEVTALNYLARQIADKHINIDEASAALKEILTTPRIKHHAIFLFASFANASFCYLFGGDYIAMGLVFIATITGLYLKYILESWHINNKLVFLTCSFTASLIAAIGVIFSWGNTPHTGLASSVLFLIPGIPLINAMMDIMDGHILMGFARAVQASILIICIALGLSLTMIILGVSLL